jgi:hypothetical protein
LAEFIKEKNPGPSISIQQVRKELSRSMRGPKNYKNNHKKEKNIYHQIYYDLTGKNNRVLGRKEYTPLNFMII